MRINVKRFIVNVEQAVNTLAGGQVATIPSENIFVKSQPWRARFQSKQWWILRPFLLDDMIVIEMIYTPIFLHIYRRLLYSAVDRRLSELLQGTQHADRPGHEIASNLLVTRLSRSLMTLLNDG